MIIFTVEDRVKYIDPSSVQLATMIKVFFWQGWRKMFAVFQAVRCTNIIPGLPPNSKFIFETLSPHSQKRGREQK
jgi:hypothetical protein